MCTEHGGSGSAIIRRSPPRNSRRKPNHGKEARPHEKRVVNSSKGHDEKIVPLLQAAAARRVATRCDRTATRPDKKTWPRIAHLREHKDEFYNCLFKNGSPLAFEAEQPRLLHYRCAPCSLKRIVRPERRRLTVGRSYSRVQRIAIITSVGDK